jgi:hypothetical protein
MKLERQMLALDPARARVAATRMCRVCGEDISHMRRDAKTCRDAKCRKAHQREKKTRSETPTLTRPECKCEAPFIWTDPDGLKRCVHCGRANGSYGFYTEAFDVACQVFEREKGKSEKPRPLLPDEDQFSRLGPGYEPKPPKIRYVAPGASWQVPE